MTLSQLLPYDPALKKNGDLKTGINEYALLLNCANNAALAWNNSEFKAFDANAGDDACEIRAARVVLMAKKCGFNSDTILNVKKDLEGLHPRS